ncbi:MAG: PAS domain S-box protein [Deltaproteobacteria bacterium]|nr:PAS domain S-box protein [Deltaproteobacteria bacterium]
MAKKPTYEELRQRVKKLEREAAIWENRGIIDAMIDGVIVFDFEGRVVFTNHAWFTMFGVKPKDIIGKSVMEIPGIEWQRKQDMEAFLPLLKEAMEKGSLGPFELTVTTHDKRKKPVSIAGGTTKATRGEPEHIVAVVRDITQRKQAEEALRESEERLQSIIDNTTAVIYLKDRDGKYILINSQFETLFHITKDQVIDKTDYDIYPREISDALRENDLRVLEVDGPLEFEEIVPHDDGIHIYISIKFPLRDSSGFSYGVCGISSDITARKQTEEHIRALTQQLIQAQEIERHRISRELHDHVAQDLAASKVACGLLLKPARSLAGDLKQDISKISNMLGSAITAVRDLAYNLRPQDLEEVGLVQSVFQYCEDFSEKSGVPVDFNYTGIDSLRLNLNAEINIYRLIQEGLNNIRKHADATHATIRLVGASPSIILRIEDNGKGFDVEKRLVSSMAQKRMGLRNMRERATLLQGQMKIHSKPKVGTVISIKFPYRENKDESKKNHIDSR